ncbi:polysaccharide ABC transporter ATP-binding protein [Pedobacter sp. P351]|uniref:ABC transporter ATP-binding protein n=1 Tax=Pedobacter superstes TaxID=3133441 RepID=UPI00309A6146
MAIAIKVEGLSKQYRLGLTGTGSIAHDINRFWHKARGKEDPYIKIGEENDRSKKGSSEYVWSLRDINFDIEQGSAVGIIGRNGAGKSTLLKILSLVTAPTTGSFKSRGRIASLLEVGTGFHPELSGLENIFLNGAILGMRKKEIKRKLDEIIDFSGVERYINTPVKRYSSGMYVRLAFAVAAHLESEIIIIDEVLAVGDTEFQKKCVGKMNDVSKSEGRTILFVSHNLGAVKQLCKSSILLDRGKLALYDKTDDVVRSYLEQFESSNPEFKGPLESDKDIWFTRISPADSSGRLKDHFFHDEEIYFNFELSFNVQKHKHDYSIFFMVLDSNKTRIFSAESQIIRSKTVQLVIEAQFLVRGSYSIHTFIHKPRTEQIDVAEDVCNFKVVDNGSPLLIHGDYDYGSIFGKVDWRYSNGS